MGTVDISFKGTIQETMLGPLWARAKYSQLYPELLNDQKAIEIIKNIDYNFYKIQEYLGEWRALGLLVRAKNFDKGLIKFIKKKPYATVVNIGAGLDTSFFRIDNSKIKWYDLDLPDAITYRRKFLSESPRNKFISNSAFDYSWFEDIDYSQEKGIFFILGGFIYYYTKEKISSLFRVMANHFPGGELIFDCISKIAVKIGNRKAKKSGIEESLWHLGIGNPEKEITSWSNKFQVIDWFTIWKRTSINPKWSKKTRKMIKISKWLKISKIVQLKLLK
jgi:O-methyltransferase involved in polyketide biosynthesis